MLRKLDSSVDIYSPDGTFNLINLTPNDTGLYQVNVTNILGYETEIFTIHVMGEEKDFCFVYSDFNIAGFTCSLAGRLKDAGSDPSNLRLGASGKTLNPHCSVILTVYNTVM